MRILIDYRPALRRRTGVGLWVAKLVEALARLTVSPPLQVIAFSSSWKDALTRPLPPGVVRSDHRVPVKVLNWLWHRREWPAVETLGPSRLDIVHSPSPLLIPTHGAARVVTIHDLDFLDHPEHTAREVRRDYAALARRHAQRADRIVTPSHYTADEVASRFQMSRDRISVCANGAPSWERRTSEPADGHILFVGTLAPRKNLDRLLSAYALLLQRRSPLPSLVITGQADVGAVETMARLDSPPLAGHVRMTGYVDAATLRALYEKAVLLALPSLDEGFGIPALEAMTLGVPVVAAHRGALPEVVGDAGLLVDPLDVSAFAAAIERVLTDDELRRRLAAAGPVRASQFSWRSSASALLEAYALALEHRQVSKHARRD